MTLIFAESFFAAVVVVVASFDEIPFLAASALTRSAASLNMFDDALISLLVVPSDT